MNTSFERSAKATDEWYTPLEIISSLGEFDLDPCAPVNPLWRTAKVIFKYTADTLCIASSPTFLASAWDFLFNALCNPRRDSGL